MSTQIPDSELGKIICVTCGTQYDSDEPAVPANCHICDDPRQYVPPSGQLWTTLRENISSGNMKNTIEVVPSSDGQIYTIVTHPKLGIGQRAHLIRTPKGNILWDLVAFIDDDTIERINELGGVDAIVVSHPHFYTTFATWSEVFGQPPVYLAPEDESWISRHDPAASSAVIFITESTHEIIPDSGVTAIKVGGHFPGSMVLHWRNRIFTADSVMIVPSGLYSIDRPEGTVSFSFMWSYPNQIPLCSEAIVHIIGAIAPFQFEIAHGDFPGQEIKRDAKQKLIKSADIIISIMKGIQPGDVKRESREFWRT